MGGIYVVILWIFCGWCFDEASSYTSSCPITAKWAWHQILISLLIMHITHIGTYSDENNSGFVHTLSTIVILGTKLVFSKYPVLVSV